MKKILIVVDMQNDFIDGSLGTKEAVAILPAVKAKIKAYKDKGDIIIYTRDTHQENYLLTQEGKKLPVPHCIEGTEGWEIADGLMVEKAEVINKETFGFYGWDRYLAPYLEGEDEVSVELIGLCTDICVVSNAIVIKTFFPDIPVYVDAKCCAGVTPETHKAALETMKMCQVNVEE